MDFYGVFWGLCGNEFMTQLFLVSLFFVPWQRRRKLFLVWYLLSVAAFVVVGRFVILPQPWGYLVGFVMMLGIVYASFKGKFFEALFHAVNIYCVQFAMSAVEYSIGFGLIVSADKTFEAINIVSIVVLFVTCVVSFFAYTLRHVRKNTLQFNSPFVIVAGAALITVAVFLSYYGQVATYYGGMESVKSILTVQIYLKTTALVCAAVTIIVNFANSNNLRLKDENRILQLLLKKDQEQYETARLASEQINIKYHDYKHLIRNGHIESPAENDANSASRFFTGNKALDVVFNEKFFKCQQQNISLICTADGEALAFMAAHRIYSLIGNAIDNAIEGLEDVQETEKREITVSITRRGNMCLIRVNNYAQNEVVFDNGMPVTSKKDAGNHGFGTKSMKGVAENYGGEIYFSIKDHIFTLLIMIPIAES